MQSVLAFFQLRSWGTERRMLATRETWKGAHMARVRSLEREDLPAEHRHIYDDIAGSRGRMQPNFKVLLNNPLATARMAALGGYVRFEAPLPPRVKMLAVLATARENEGDYVWAANLPQARDAGVDEATIQAIRECRALQGLAPEDAAIVQFTLELLRQPLARPVSPGVHAARTLGSLSGLGHVGGLLDPHEPCARLGQSGEYLCN